MGAAAVISLAEVREQKQRAQIRRQLHEQFERVRFRPDVLF